jgi:RNA polymerase sigma-70 factor, ECF subfamily
MNARSGRMNSEQPFDDLYSEAYDHLRKIAASIGRHDRAATLNPTALVNEAYLRLVSARSRSDLESDEMRKLAVTSMRRVLVDAARRRLAQKRGKGSRYVTLLPEAHADAVTPDAVLALDDALKRLASIDERQASIVELRFFGGYSVEETAAMLGTSESTVAREWRMARAWLSRTISEELI